METFWEQFARNIATDLAPFISLFGDAPTKQYLIESTNPEDILIFAIAPVGIIKSIVSVIRISGIQSLRGFIGRSQERKDDIEVELRKSTSRNVSELFTDGGIARVPGRAKILELVHDTKALGQYEDSLHHTAGLYLPREFFNGLTGKQGWEDSKENRNYDIEEYGFASQFAPYPNLSLNCRNKSRSRSWFFATVILGVTLQSIVLLWAGFAEYTFHFVQSSSFGYAVPFTVIGTVLVSLGVGLSLSLLEGNAEQRTFRKHSKKNDCSARHRLYWIQPGNQEVGGQIFDSFAHTDSAQTYTTSWRDDTLKKGDARIKFEILAWIAVLSAIIGFLLQTIGLRACHSSVSVAQLGVMIIMTFIRGKLRLERASDNHRSLHEHEGHELDWLAFQLVKNSDGQIMERNNLNEFIGHEISWLDLDLDQGLPFSIPLNDQSLDDCGVQEKNGTMLSVSGQGKQRVIGFQNHEGACRSDEVKEWLQEVHRDVEGQAPSQIHDAEKVFLYRARLARMTDRWEDGFVAGRDLARRLSRAIEDTADIVFEKFNLNLDWKQCFKIYWPIKCVHTQLTTETFIALTRHQYSRDELSLTGTRYSNWKVEVSELEAALALRLWALRSQKQVDNRHSNRVLWTFPAADGTCTHDFWRGEKHPPIRTERGEKTHTTSLPTRLPMPELYAQEIYSLFFRAIAHTFDSVGGRDIIKNGQKSYIENENITLIQAAFAESGLGSKDDAWACIFPTLITQHKLASLFHCTLNQHLSPIIHENFPVDLEKDESARHRMLNYICQTNISAINTKDSDGNTALHLAIKLKYETLAVNLLEFDADPNFADSWGTTPLFTAAEQDNVRLVERLLKKGANPNQLDFVGNTPLHVAAEHGAYDCAKELLYKGAEVDVKNTRSETPTMRAMELVHSCKEHGTKILRLLLDAGADPNTQDHIGYTLMHCAISYTNIDELVKMLLDKGADIHLKDGIGETPLHLAAAYGYEEAVKALLNGNADPTVKDTSGETALEIAKRKCHDEITKLLEAAETKWMATKKQKQLRSGSLRGKHTKRSATDEGLRSRTF